ncbi:MAG: hypothetical protein A3G59_02435 [Candidatus Taylorbacteria bacterium RIFCSPLOWO2_12_FULL_47_20]|uniref:DUF2914 domain-containing protein n=2 Tax=Candidatus Tayloriibacteriota TaxID=1817919 RepID=A0A1G2P858_9BACT|nr:MAG: hypothetical protein A3H68_00255 [Candidatus Taylorbacteria bacterium RIFCSPLOWO2_02_FULL_46_40]OHA44536.1 MAG: hypothetical protein A3G59_02435 [Candidatus Taylorbacteria bacterium RIFCSPLOWO2_12_FULL_47_20]
MQWLEKIKNFAERNERHLSLAAFGAGFVWDNLTLTRIDLLYDNLVMTLYMVVAVAGIIAHNAHDSGTFRGKTADRIAPWLPYAFQFAFGGLMSGFVVFYARSATLSASWPFLLFLLLLFAGNEFFKKKYAKLTFQMSMFFISIFSYCIFLVPVILQRMGAGVFLLSAAISVAVTVAVSYALKLVATPRFKISSPYLKISVTIILVAFIFSYFTNIIPPLPLSLKKIGIYHNIVKVGNDYTVTYQPAAWYEFWRSESRIFAKNAGETVYAFSSVFAPGKIATQIFHEWSVYNEDSGDWRVASRIPFRIEGGRGDGYRGYTLKTNVSAGKWRVRVKTARGQVLGERIFEVVNAGESVRVETVQV